MKKLLNTISGFVYQPKDAWDALSYAAKSEMMRVAVRNGITDLKTIRKKYNEFAEGGSMEESMNTIPEDYAPLASPTWQPVIDKMKQDSYKSNVEDFAYRVQKMHPEITQQQVEEAYKSVPIIASDSRRGRETGKYVYGDESGYGQRIMLYPNRIKEDQGVGGLTKEDQLRSAMEHETNHLYVHTLLGNNYTDEEKALLDAAYPNDLFHVPEGGDIYDEKRAYNMQVRNALSKAYGNVVGADYDKATEKMKPNDVMWNYSQLGSGYMSDYQKVKQKYKKGSKWDQNQVDAILKATKDVAYTPTVNPYEYGEGVNYAALGGPIVEAAMNEYRDGGGIHIKDSKKGTFTAAAKKHGKSVQAFASQVLAHPENYSPAMRKKANFARNASRWKHGLGGNLFDGTSEDTQQMSVARPDATYVARTPIFSPISKKEYDWEDAALHRTNQVYSNYNKAKDEPLSLGNTIFRNSLRWVKDNIYEDFPSGVSNCTLSATQWVDPQTPVKRAKSIHTNPKRFNYTAIDSADVVPGNLVISKVPNKDSYHTMMVTGFAGQDSTANFSGKNYPVKKGEPLVTYSRGGHDNSFIQRNVPLSIYTVNSDGHTQNLFYRYNYPREIFLPEIVVTPNKKKK